MDVGQQWRRRMTGFWMMANPVFGRRFRHLHKLHTDGFMGLNTVCLPDGNPPGAVYRSSLPATPVSTPIWENHQYFSEQILRDRLCKTPSPRKYRLFEPRGSIPDMGLQGFELPSTSSSPATDNLGSDLDNDDLTSPEDEKRELSSPRPPSEDEKERSGDELEFGKKTPPPPERLPKKLFVGNISYQVTSKELKQYFSQFGRVLYCEIVQDHFKRWPKGYGFVTFAKAESASKALQVPFGTLELDGRSLRVFSAEEKRTSKLRKEAQELCTDYKMEIEPVMENPTKKICVENINDLDDDMIVKIFEYLTLVEKVKIERVCKRWQILALKTWQSQNSLENWSSFSIFGAGIALNNSVLRSLLKKCAPNLKKIDLSKATHILDFQAMEIITHLCPNLEHADLSGLPVTNVSLQQLAQKCPRLKVIIVKKCFDAGEKGFWWVLHLCKDLEYLDASQSMRLTGQCFHMARPKLRTVILNNCSRLCPQGFSKLATKCQNLSDLHLNACTQLTDRALELLCQSLRNLKVFHLDGHFKEITPTGLHHIGRMSSLEELSLKANSAVTDDVLTAIARGCRKLRWLNVSGCFVGGVSDVSLKSVSECPRLRTLFISYLDKITDDGVSSMARQGQLEVLEARGCPGLGDKGFIAVALLCPSLKWLDISGCHLVTNYTLSACLDSVADRSRKLVVTIGGTGAKAEDLQMDNPNLEISCFNYCQDDLRPDRINYIGIRRYDSEDADEEDELEEEWTERSNAGFHAGWHIPEHAVDAYLAASDPAFEAEMWPS